MARLNLPYLNGLTTPAFHHEPLANGIPAGYVPLPEVGLTCLDICIGAGSRHEAPAEMGLAHFLEHMVFKGSRHLAEGEFDWRIETLGGTSNAATGLDHVHFQVSCPAPGVREALELLTELVLFPSFQHQAFALERLVVQEELNQSLDQPDEVAYQVLLKRACGSHHYGRPILGTAASLAALTVDAMGAFHGRHYGAGALAVVVSGAVVPQVFHDHLRCSPLNQLPPVPPVNGVGPQLHIQPGESHLKVKRLQCARLMAGWAMPPAGERTMVAGVDLATFLLAEGRCSWLIASLREHLAVMDELDMELIPLEAGSLLVLEASCAAHQLGKLEQLLPQCLTDWLSKPPQPEALERARHQMVNRIFFSLESPGGIAAQVGPSLLHGRPAPLAGQLLGLQAWTPATMHQQVMPLFHPQRAHWLSVLPSS